MSVFTVYVGPGGFPLFGVICLIVGIFVVIAVVLLTVAGVIIIKRHRMRMQMRRVFDVDVSSVCLIVCTCRLTQTKYIHM